MKGAAQDPRVLFLRSYIRQLEAPRLDLPVMLHGRLSEIGLNLRLPTLLVSSALLCPSSVVSLALRGETPIVPLPLEAGILSLFNPALVVCLPL